MKNFLCILVLLMLLYSAGSFNTLSKEISQQKGVLLVEFDGYKLATPEFGLDTFAPSELSNTQKDSVLKYVRYYFRDFDVEVTTDYSVFYASSKYHRVRCIVSTTPLTVIDMWGIFSYTPAGRSLIGTTPVGDTSSAFVNPDMLRCEPKIIAQGIAHEVGHSLGLNHQSDFITSPTLYKFSEYDFGDSLVAPIMGCSYYAKEAVWRKGLNTFGQEQDDMDLISKVWCRKDTFGISK